MGRTRDDAPELPVRDEPVSVWERQFHRGRQALTLRQIAVAGIEIADADGLDAVTIRRLAGRLEVAPMALYRYVRTRDEIVELMTDEIHAARPPVARSSAWRDVLRTYARQTRAVGLEHPWLLQAAAHAPTTLTPAQLAVTEGVLASLAGLEVDVDRMKVIVDTVTAYAWGATIAEVTQQQLMKHRGWSTPTEMRAGLGHRMGWLLSTGRYPTFESYIRRGKRKDDTEWRFRLGLECVLDGLAVRLEL